MDSLFSKNIYLPPATAKGLLLCLPDYLFAL
jgi:hypothetical protein